MSSTKSHFWQDPQIEFVGQILEEIFLQRLSLEKIRELQDNMGAKTKIDIRGPERAGMKLTTVVSKMLPGRAGTGRLFPLVKPGDYISGSDFSLNWGVYPIPENIKEVGHSLRGS